jgi:choline-phosphate cytidylyltransferase
MSRRGSISANSVTSDDLAEYDVVSSGLRSLESSVDDLSGGRRSTDVYEPPPAQDATEKFATAALTSEDVRAYVRHHVEKMVGGERSAVWERRTVRVYVDGLYDGFHAG